MLRANRLLRWLPLAFIATFAVLFEPIRSGFNIANQPCEILPSSNQLAGTFFNVKHIIGYGAICLISLLTTRNNSIWHSIFGVFTFSIAMEFLQRFFVTGHCRAWDLIPNALGIGIAVAIFLGGRTLLPKV